MKKRISKKIRNRIISKTNITSLINYLFTNFDKIISEHKKFVISFRTSDLELYELENSNLGDNEELLDLKKIEKITIDLIDYRGDKSISIELSQSHNSWSNSIIINGSDEEWVNHQNSKIDEIIDSWKPQNKLFVKYQNIFYHILCINIGWLFINFIMKIIKISGFQVNTKFDDDNFIEFIVDKMITSFPISRFILIIIFSWFIGSILLFFHWDRIVKYFEKLWPSIEFDFGPEHLRNPKRNRKAIGVLLSLIVIPILLQLLMS